nr:ribonuclease domain-containing protein [Sphaerotilus montanus]
MVQARGESETVGLQSGAVRLSELPPETADTHRRILSGGPFRYPSKDGSVFGNRERHLPRETRGYYREYTVPTAGSRDRGARRIICGGREPTTPDVCFYTQDHYASFRRIAP